MLRKIPILNLYYLLAYAWNRLDEAKVVLADAERSNDLPNLFARILVSGTGHLVKRGLDRGYVLRSDVMTCIRGRVNFARSIKGMTFVRGMLDCDYSEYEHDVLHNQILYSTIRHLALCDLSLIHI